MHFPTFVVAAILLVALPLARAADCTGSNPPGECGKSNVASSNDQYVARQNYCGYNLWQTVSCYVDGNVKITLNQPGANNQQTCWDALADIINQCGLSYVRGVYNYNGAQYALTRCVKNDGYCSTGPGIVEELPSATKYSI